MGWYQRRVHGDSEENHIMWHIIIFVCLIQSNVALLRIQDESTTTGIPGYTKKELKVFGNGGGTTFVATEFYNPPEDPYEPEYTVEDKIATNGRVLKMFERYMNGIASGKPLWTDVAFWENHFPSS